MTIGEWKEQLTPEEIERRKKKLEKKRAKAGYPTMFWDSSKKGTYRKGMENDK